MTATLRSYATSLATLSRDSLPLVGEFAPTTAQSLAATAHYVHATHQLTSINELSSVPDDRLLASVHGIVSLARDIIETHDAFVYLYVESVPKEVRSFRHELYFYHAAIEREAIATKIGFHTATSSQGWIAAIHEPQLLANTYFQSLPDKIRNRLMKGARAFYWHGAKRKFPNSWTAARRDGIYSLLSNSVHATENGVSASVGMPPARLLGTASTFRFALIAAIQYYANLAELFFNHRHVLRDKLPVEFRALLRDILKRDLIGEEVPSATDA